jgi:hypothetical protein
MLVGWGRKRLANLVGLLLIGLLFLATAAPALASIHTYHEKPGQTTVRSRQSLRDKDDLAWQATLFKRQIEGNLQGIYLRLVGFPERVTVDRQKNLLIQTGTLASWEAPPLLDPQTRALPNNVAQYNFVEVLTQLKGAIPLTLTIPLENSAYAYVVVAPFVVDEWLQLNQTEP